MECTRCDRAWQHVHFIDQIGSDPPTEGVTEMCQTCLGAYGAIFLGVWYRCKTCKGSGMVTSGERPELPFPAPGT